MRNTRRTWALVLIVAAALLVTALVGPVRRAIDERTRAGATRVLAEQLAQERAVASARFASDRERILAAMRERLDREDFAGAMTLASPFVHLGDEALRDLYKEAASAESRRQRREIYRAVVARDCNEDAARLHATGVLAAASAPSPATGAVTTLVRLTGAPAREAIRARLREAPPPETGASTPQPVERSPVDVQGLRQEFRARVLPDYLGFLLAPGADELICAWRVEAVDTQRALRLTMDLWLAPLPDGKQLSADLAALAVQPR